MYKPKQYWTKRKNPNNPFISRTPEFKFIMKHIGEPESILDFGCGVGATLECYPKTSFVHGVDFVNRYQPEWISKAIIHGFKHTHTIMSIDELKFIKPFDVGVLSKVCLHVEPNEVEKLIEKMAQCCERLIITTATVDNPQSHCFNYNYDGIFDDKGLTVLNKETFENQLYYNILCKKTQ